MRIETNFKIFRASNIIYLVLTVAIHGHCASTETVCVKSKAMLLDRECEAEFNAFIDALTIWMKTWGY